MLRAVKTYRSFVRAEQDLSDHVWADGGRSHGFAKEARHEFELSPDTVNR